jgi:hypothetical protein
MKKKRVFKKILIVLYVLFAILILLLLINLKVWKYLEKKDVKMVTLEDRCSVLFNNILHTIKDESGCENSCRAECSTREMEFYKSEFSLNLEGCNDCKCYCK